MTDSRTDPNRRVDLSLGDTQCPYILPRSGDEGHDFCTLVEGHSVPHCTGYGGNDGGQTTNSDWEFSQAFVDERNTEAVIAAAREVKRTRRSYLRNKNAADCGAYELALVELDIALTKFEGGGS